MMQLPRESPDLTKFTDAQLDARAERFARITSRANTVWWYMISNNSPKTERKYDQRCQFRDEFHRCAAEHGRRTTLAERESMLVV